MGAFVSDKSTYTVTITPEDCEFLEHDESVVLLDGMSPKTVRAMEGLEGINAGVAYLKSQIVSWTFDQDISDESIDSLRLEILLKIWEEGESHIPLSLQPPSPTSPDSSLIPSSGEAS